MIAHCLKFAPIFDEAAAPEMAIAVPRSKGCQLCLDLFGLDVAGAVAPDIVCAEQKELGVSAALVRVSRILDVQRRVNQVVGGEFVTSSLRGKSETAVTGSGPSSCGNFDLKRNALLRRSR